jgi:hypothetical protein
VTPGEAPEQTWLERYSAIESLPSHPKVNQPECNNQNPEENASTQGRMLFLIHFIKRETTQILRHSVPQNDNLNAKIVILNEVKDLGFSFIL